MDFFGITLHSLGLFGIMIAVFYAAILGFTLADLRSGVRKALQAGMYRSSTKYRETINKLARYFNMAFALTLLDIIVVFSMACLGWAWYPHFPFATLIATIGVGCIEIKSIYEKWDDKEKMDVKEVAAALVKMQKDGHLEALREALEEFSKKEKEKENDKV